MSNQTDVFHLKPTGNGSHGMHAIAIVLPKPGDSSASRSIGRAELDSVSDDKHIQFISRQHAEISCSPSGDFFVTPVSRQPGHVFVNGSSIPDKQQHKLQIGDTITLLGKLNHFSYVLTSGPPPQESGGVVAQPVVHSTSSSSSDGSNSNNSRKRERPDDDGVVVVVVEELLANKRPNNNGDHTAQQQQPVASEKSDVSIVTVAPTAPSGITAANLESHYECSICFEPLALTHSINPCGDNFCYVCIVDWAEKNKKCPMCNAPFDVKNLLPNRIVDNLIGEVLKLDQDKLQAWQQRCEEGNDRKKAAAAGGGGGGGKKGAKKAGGRAAAAASPVVPAAAAARSNTRSQPAVAAAPAPVPAALAAAAGAPPRSVFGNGLGSVAEMQAALAARAAGSSSSSSSLQQGGAAAVAAAPSSSSSGGGGGGGGDIFDLTNDGNSPKRNQHIVASYASHGRKDCIECRGKILANSAQLKVMSSGGYSTPATGLGLAGEAWYHLTCLNVLVNREKMRGKTGIKWEDISESSSLRMMDQSQLRQILR